MNENQSTTENSTAEDKSKRGRSVSISIKILAVTLGTTIIVLTVSGIASFIMASNAIENKLFDQLTSVREIKGQQIENYVGTISRQIATMSENPAIIDAMSTLKSAFHRVSEYEQRTTNSGADSHLDLLSYYRDEFLSRLRPNTLDKLQGVPLSRFFPSEPGTI